MRTIAYKWGGGGGGGLILAIFVRTYHVDDHKFRYNLVIARR